MKKETLQQRAEAAASKKSELMNSLNSELAKMTEKKADLEARLNTTDISSLDEVQKITGELTAVDAYLAILRQKIKVATSPTKEGSEALAVFIAEAEAELSKESENLWIYFHKLTSEITEKMEVFTNKREELRAVTAKYSDAVNIKNPDVSFMKSSALPILIMNYSTSAAKFLELESDPLLGNPFLKK